MSFLTIAKKDFFGFVKSPMFLAVTGLCALVFSFVFIRQLEAFLQAPNGGNLHRQLIVQFLSFVHIVLLFAIPAITMRLLSEEKRLGTYDLLLTAPIKSSDIALGKFIAGFLAVSCLIVLASVYVLFLGFIEGANLQWQQTMMSFLGLILICSVYVALGLFASSLTQSVVLAVIMGLIFNLVALVFTGGLGEGATDYMWVGISEHINLGKHLVNFLFGKLELASVIYFFSFIGLFVFLTERVVESSRWRA